MSDIQLDIKKIAEDLIKEIETELVKATDAAKVAEGAKQGVIVFFNRIMEAAQPKPEVPSSGEADTTH